MILLVISSNHEARSRPGDERRFEEKKIEYSFTVDASPAEVYRAWTIPEDVRSSFAPDCEIEIEKHGDYHIFFSPAVAEGRRGADDELVLAHQENEMLSFAWGFPPSFPELRANQKTVVLLRFVEVEDGKREVRFSQTGWGTGPDWQEAFDYFVDAWGQLVLPRLRYSLEVGPIDWEAPPVLSGYVLDHPSPASTPVNR